MTTCDKKTQEAIIPFTQEDEAALKDSLKRCSLETIEAAIDFQKSKSPTQVPAIILGIIERFLEPEIRPRLKGASDSLRLIEDLGIDSLTMVEIVILVEEVLKIKIDNEELRDLRTVGEVKLFIDCKVKGIPLPSKPIHFSLEEVAAVMPHQHPFLFIREAILRAEGAESFYKISGDEFFLEGHFKNNPVFPASLMLEALGQLGVFFLLKAKHENITANVNPEAIYFISCDGVRCQHICKPGQKLDLHIKLKRIKHPLATFEGSISIGSEKVAFAEEITLAFDYHRQATGIDSDELNESRFHSTKAKS